MADTSLFMEESYDDDDCCAICFEQDRFIKLPCACRINYCARCWDRALASSVTARGRPQCPSCRTVFRVDFKPEEGGITFSKEADGTASCDWTSRLYCKAKPVQIQLLRDFGASPASLRSAACPPCQATAEDSGTAAPPGTEPDLCAEGKMARTRTDHSPSCVCGAQLEHISGRARVLRMLEDADPDWRLRVVEADGLIEKLLTSSLVTCDLCGQDGARSGSIWSCENGPHTVLHPAGYDICERCFARYAGPRAASLYNSTAERGQGRRLLTQLTDRGCQACVPGLWRLVSEHWRKRWMAMPADAASS